MLAYNLSVQIVCPASETVTTKGVQFLKYGRTKFDADTTL